MNLLKGEIISLGFLRHKLCTFDITKNSSFLCFSQLGQADMGIANQ